jgi:hypothetical protein
MKIESIALAALVTIVFLTVLTIGAELSTGLLAWLKATFYHHWIGKGILGIIVFALVAFFGPPVPLERQSRLAVPVIALCTLALFAYYVLHYFKAF